ncbi:hypothetical protein Nepgr_005672 [Nepenthes gracilis]|uniref:Reverse transcriptase domain-containing protein n=1 Tax=Nepenthes gracilis TaxID=150966 RepID=A0AAD3S3M5_NEPGR|nr:hypothetical protein Nepgr_005672 [Nepenthes gracilis]
MAHVTFPHTDPLVVSALVSAGGADYQLKRVFIDNGSSQNLLYLTAFIKLRLKRDQMKAANGPLYGLDNEPVPMQGIVRLEVTMGTHPRSITRELAFLVVDLPSVYNAILGRPFLTAFEAVTSIPHLKVKFPTPWGVGEVLGDQEMGRTCYLSQINPAAPSRPSEDLDLRDETSLQQAQSGEETEAIPLNPFDPERCVNVGRSLPPADRDKLITFLRANSDVFAWVPADMPGISAEVIVHKLGLDASRKPVRQKWRNHSVEKLVAIREEVKRLLDAGFIREVQYPEWLSNVVLIKKSSGKWRMCVDFTDVNKACPKDSFPLLRIDQLVDSTSGHELLSFMDAYSRYNQIRMDPEDEEHTSFMTDQWTYCYKMMPFGLKNAGATYRRLVNKMFKLEIGP